jgi:NAD(P)H-hydrate epimerase
MTGSFPIAPADIPYITTEQMIEVDRAMMEDFGISLLQMMENAGRNLASVVVNTALNGGTAGKRVLVAAGPGGNGGGALVAARNLHNRGCAVTVLLVAADESKITDAVRNQLRIVRSIGLSVDLQWNTNFDDADVIVDGIFGYSLTGNPREPAASVITRINESISGLQLLLREWKKNRQSKSFGKWAVTKFRATYFPDPLPPMKRWPG